MTPLFNSEISVYLKYKCLNTSLEERRKYGLKYLNEEMIEVQEKEDGGKAEEEKY